METLALALCLVAGLAMGLLGGGGSILLVPILVYVMGLEAHDAIAASLIVVALTSLAGLVTHARAGRVRWRVAGMFGAAGMAGSFGAGLIARFLPGTLLLMLLATMMTATALVMLRGGAAQATGASGPTCEVVTGRVLLHGLMVGAATGLVGAGGGFVIVPALVLLCRLPMDTAVGTSLAIIAMQSLAGVAGHVSHAHLDPWAVARVAGVAMSGAVVGALLVERVPRAKLRQGFGLLVLVLASVVLVQQVPPLLGVQPRLGRDWPWLAGVPLATIAGALAWLGLRGHAAAPKGPAAARP